MIDISLIAAWVYALLVTSGAVKPPRLLLRAIVAYHARHLRRTQ